MPDKEKAGISVGPEQQASYSNVDYSKAHLGKFYANHVAAQFTLFDIRLLLSIVDLNAAANQLVGQETLTVFMSPEIAALLHEILGKAIQQYKAKYGDLRMDPAGKPVVEDAKPI
jgi:hypothetical protein